MKTNYLLILFILVISCGNKKNNQVPVTSNTTVVKDTNTTENKDTLSKNNELLQYSQSVLHSIKQRDVNTLSTYIHPTEGVRFSPYGYIDVKTDAIFSAKELMDRFETKKLYKWGYFDGSGELIELTCREYFDKFIYDIDFEKQSVAYYNECKGGGNSQNNIWEVYDGLDFVEYYFPGTQQYEGMDWKALRLVYKKENDTYYLVGIVHDEWTI